MKVSVFHELVEIVELNDWSDIRLNTTVRNWQKNEIYLIIKTIMQPKREFDNDKNQWYCDMPKAGLVITENWTSIINWTEPYYIRLEWKPELTGDFIIQNQKAILERKYYVFEALLSTFNL